MKRKDVDAVNDDFSDFTMSSPALKIRRLDAEFAPIIEEEPTVNPVAFGKSLPYEDNFVEQAVESSPIAIDELNGSVPENEERSIVVFNPGNSLTMLQSRSPLSLSVDSDFLSGFKNRVWSNPPSVPKSLVGDESNGFLAVVPWVPGAQACDSMNGDAMDIEDSCETQQMPRNEFCATSASEGLNQWQQHCMIPQPPNWSTPITWFGRDS